MSESVRTRDMGDHVDIQVGSRISSSKTLTPTVMQSVMNFIPLSPKAWN